MSTPVYLSNPYDELQALQWAMQQAVMGAITRIPVVRNRDYDGLWPGPYPLILLRDLDFNLYQISGGQLGLKGQQGTAPSYYSIEMEDVVDLRDTGTERVAAAQTDLLLLERAIIAYFDHLPHKTLPDPQGNAVVYRCGEQIRFRSTRPFGLRDGGEVRVVKAGYISVLGAPRPQTNP